MNQSKLMPALIGGTALGVASGIPGINLANCFCCAWVVGGGLLASFLWLRNLPPQPPPYGDGLLLGGLTGIVGAVVSTVVGIPFQLLFAGSFDASEILENLPPEVEIPPALQEFVAGSAAGGFSVMAMLFSLLVSLVIYAVFAGIGALIGTALFTKKPATAVPPAP